MKKTAASFESAQAWIKRKNPSIRAASDVSTLIKERLMRKHELQNRIEVLAKSQHQFETQMVGQLEALKQSMAAQVAALTKGTGWLKFVRLLANVRAGMVAFALVGFWAGLLLSFASLL